MYSDEIVSERKITKWQNCLCNPICSEVPGTQRSLEEIDPLNKFLQTGFFCEIFCGEKSEEYL